MLHSVPSTNLLIHLPQPISKAFSKNGRSISEVEADVKPTVFVIWKKANIKRSLKCQMEEFLNWKL